MRARNLKPGFFSNEQLGSCSPLARLLFAGLWCLADRDGRLEDRVERIKALVLPYDDCDVDDLLTELNSRGFILRYIVRGAAFICLPTFSDHQHPHPKESQSKIPPPKARVVAALRRWHAVENNGQSGCISESLIPHSAATACSAAAAAASLEVGLLEFLPLVEAIGLPSDLAQRLLAQAADPALIREVLAFHSAASKAGKLKKPAGAIRTMLVDPISWGFERTGTGGWKMPSDVRPPVKADPRAESKKLREEAAAIRAQQEADREAGRPLSLKELRQKGGTP